MPAPAPVTRKAEGGGGRGRRRGRRRAAAAGDSGGDSGRRRGRQGVEGAKAAGERRAEGDLAGGRAAGRRPEPGGGGGERCPGAWGRARSARADGVGSAGRWLRGWRLGLGREWMVVWWTRNEETLEAVLYMDVVWAHMSADLRVCGFEYRILKPVSKYPLGLKLYPRPCPRV